MADRAPPRQDGSIDRPTAPGYVTGAVDNLPPPAQRGLPRPLALAEILRGEPQWLERDLWDLFTIEETDLTARDSWGDEAPWRTTLATLAADGTIPLEAIAARLREILTDLDRAEPRALLATPTHRGGWVDAAQAVRRVAALDGARPLALDLARLVPRIAPDGRAQALQDAARIRGEAGAVLVAALGGSARRPWRTKLAPAWEAAAQARDPPATRRPNRTSTTCARCAPATGGCERRWPRPRRAPRRSATAVWTARCSARCWPASCASRR